MEKHIKEIHLEERRNDSFGKNYDQPQTEDQIKHNICNQESSIESAVNNDLSSPDKHTQKVEKLNCVICQKKFKSENNLKTPNSHIT